jgi:ABC-type dipeptide/oligopeptide/nickel transport system permease component
MANYLVTRIGAGLLNVALITLLIFVMLHLAPGDPVDQLVPSDAGPQQRAEARRQWGLDRPLAAQLLAYLGNVARGDLGQSLYFEEPVAKLILARAPATLELGGLAILLVIAASVVLGVAAGARAHGWLDHALMALAVCGVAMPAFWFALLLILVLGGALQLLPVAGRLSEGMALTPITGLHLLDSVLTLNRAAFWDALRHLVLPALALSGPGIAFQSRLMRSNLLEVMQQDYVRTARAKGLREVAVVARHAVWNALLPVLAAWSLLFVFLLSGSVIIETIFAWPGIGRLAVQAVGNRDYPLVQGVVLVFIALVVVVNLVADVLSAWIDPRVRFD